MAAVPYGPEAKRVLVAAFAAQRSADHREVHAEHLLLGVLEVRPDLFIAPESVADRLAKRLRRGTHFSLGHRAGKYEWSEGARGALRRAADIAKASEASEIEPGHLLSSLAHAIPESSELLDEHEVGQAPPTSASPRTAVPLVALDDAASQPYYEQIVNQLKGAVADGRLIPGEKLATVRRMADELEIAPGTVARAYRLLQADGVIVTDRSNGSTVAVPGPSSPSERATRVAALEELLKPAAVAAYHMGSSFEELREALELSARHVFDQRV